MEPPKTPECEKLSELREHYSVISEFLGFLGEEEITLAHYEPSFYQGQMLCSIGGPTTKLIMKFFDIDETKLEQERRALIDYQRELNEKKP